MNLFKSTSRPMRIGFAYDLFRHPALGQWNAEAQARWLRSFLTPAIGMAGGTVRNALESVAAEAIAWATERAEAGALPQGAAGWAMLYSGELLEGMDQWFRPMLGYDLLIGYELSANQLRFLSQQRAAFLDIGIDAVRFARRTLFRGRSNDHSVREALQRFHIPGQALAADAGFLCATRGSGSFGRPEDLLVVGQVDVDGSLIVGGRIQRIDPHLPRLAELAKQHRRVLIYPHPLALENQDVRTVLSTIPHSVLGEGQVYAALLDSRTRTVATLSSSVASEATLLGKEVVVRLIQPDGSSEALGLGVVSAYTRLDSTVAQACFWNAVFRRDNKRHWVPFSGYGPDEAALRSALGVFVATPAMVQPLRVMAANETLSLADPASAGLCRLGWSGVEAAGRWTDGPVAVIAFEAVEVGTGLVLSLHAFIGPEPRTLRLRLLLSSADGAAQEEEVQFTDEVPRKVYLAVPLPPGLVTLKLLVESPCSPGAQGISADQRQLGVQVETVQLTGPS